MAANGIKITGLAGLAALVAASAGLGTATPAVEAQPTQRAVVVREINPAAANLQRMTRRMTIELTDQRLEDVLTFITEVTGAEIEPLWRDDTMDGLDRDARITLKVTNMPALTFLDRVLEKAQTDFQQNTWQITSYGVIEVGTKDRLNRHKRLEIYDVQDLLTELPRFYDAPQIDLQGVLQGSQGGGGGQSPFTNIQQDQQDRQEEEQRREERVQRLIEIITTFVEPEQWVDNGGDGGTIRFFQGALLVNAPDYMHRGINGYPFWNNGHTQRVVGGRRYVSLNMDTGISTLDGIEQHPVSVVVGGRVIRSNDPGGGGSDKTPDGGKPGGGTQDRKPGGPR